MQLSCNVVSNDITVFLKYLVAIAMYAMSCNDYRICGLYGYIRSVIRSFNSCIIDLNLLSYIVN